MDSWEHEYMNQQHLADAKSSYAAALKRVKSALPNKNQKFQKGDRVRIDNDLGKSMNHFPRGVYATVEYTYSQAYGGDNYDSYSLLVDGFGSHSWYKEHQLTKIDNATPPPLKNNHLTIIRLVIQTGTFWTRW